MAFACFLAITIIGSILGVIGFFFDDSVAKNVKTYEISSQIKSLKIEIGAADFTVKQGEKFSVESNLKHLTVDDENGVLTIKEKRKIGISAKSAVLTLYIPEETVLENAEILTGAGQLTVKSLVADTVNFEFGAGEVVIEKLIAKSKANLVGGAGEVTISDGALHNLKLDMGVGQLNFTSALTGKCELNLGVGEANITLLGKKDDYKLDLEKGVGSMRVDGTNVSSAKGFGNGKNKVSVSGGVGDTSLNFKESDGK